MAVPVPGVRQIDIRGLLTIRLVDVRMADAFAVERQLGLRSTNAEGSSNGSVGLTLRYFDRLPDAAGPIRLVGPRNARWSGRGLALRSGRRADRWVRIPFDRIGDEMVIECEHGAGRVPLLVSIVNLSMLARGIVPLHASAFIKEGVGIAAAGWSQSGKTEALLAAVSAGGVMVADEWAYLTPAGKIFGLPTAVRLEPWHLRGGWVDAGAVNAHERRRMRRSTMLDHALTFARTLGAGGLAGRVTKRAVAAVAARNHVDVHPEVLFGGGSCAPSLVLDRLYWLVPLAEQANSRAAIGVERVKPEDVARRMTIAHLHHRLDFLDAYWRFRYAFPKSRSELVEKMSQLEETLLEKALADVPTYRLEHHAGVSPGVLADAFNLPVES